MKNILFPLLFAGLIWSSCQNGGDGVQEIRNSGPNSTLIRNPATADQPLDTNQLARIVYQESEFDFGTAKEGDIVEHVFKFTNKGKVPLIIQKCRSSCGCTIPEWPPEPIPPGGSGEVKAKFNTTGKKDFQHKIIYVTANTFPNETTVLLQGKVLGKE
jgi:hypothetical protein